MVTYLSRVRGRMAVGRLRLECLRPHHPIGSLTLEFLPTGGRSISRAFGAERYLILDLNLGHTPTFGITPTRTLTGWVTCTKFRSKTPANTHRISLGGAAGPSKTSSGPLFLRDLMRLPYALSGFMLFSGTVAERNSRNE